MATLNEWHGKPCKMHHYQRIHSSNSPYIAALIGQSDIKPNYPHPSCKGSHDHIYLEWTEECNLTNVCCGVLPGISGELEVTLPAKCEGPFGRQSLAFHVECQSFRWLLCKWGSINQLVAWFHGCMDIRCLNPVLFSPWPYLYTCLILRVSMHKAVRPGFKLDLV